ncbi:MAG TPA: GNAT family N-acetyltransferase [Bryobacteraceae bacterium]|nr:GNAT family N-acetyltransferase [Bryobacteraceae bacterium]
MPVQSAQQIAVRPMQRDDEPLLAAMYDTFEPMSEALGLPPKEQSRREAWLRTLRTAVNLVAFVDGKLAGHAALLAVDEDSAELMCFVHQNFRRNGVGTSLARAVMDHAKQRGFQRISVFINSHNLGARRGLLKFGFEPVWQDLEEAEYLYWLWGREV